MKEVWVGKYGRGVWARKGRGKTSHLFNADGATWSMAGKSLCGRVCAQRVFPENDAPRCKLCKAKRLAAIKEKRTG